MSDVLNALDATFLELEQDSDGAVMNIGAVMVFDPLPNGRAPSVEEVCAVLAPRFERLPRHSERLSSPRPSRFAWPRWVAHRRFDFHDHVSHARLPAPGGRGELCDWTADFYSHRLDRGRPLWELALIDGLANGGFALAYKTHRCLMDALDAVGVARLLADARMGGSGATASAGGEPRGGKPSRAHSIAPQPLAQAARAGLRASEAGAQAALHPRAALARAETLAEVLVREELIAAPPTSLNGPIGTSRRFAHVNVPLAELEAIRDALGGSVNDVILAASATGLRELLLGRGEGPPARRLRAMVAADVREAPARSAFGSGVGSLFLELPVAEPIPRERYRRIVASSARLRRSRAAANLGPMVDLAALAPPVLHALLARLAYSTRLFNLTIASVPGPNAPLYALGARLREIHPVVPLTAQHTVGIAVVSYDGLATVGVIADAESTPDLAVLAYGIEEGLEELFALVTGVEHVNTIEQARL